MIYIISTPLTYCKRFFSPQPPAGDGVALLSQVFSFSLKKLEPLLVLNGFSENFNPPQRLSIISPSVFLHLSYDVTTPPSGGVSPFDAFTCSTKLHSPMNLSFTDICCLTEPKCTTNI